MGYEVHITRKEHWSDQVGAGIALEEWLRYVSEDEGMIAEGFAEATTADGESVRVENAGTAVWTAYSGHGVGGNKAWFCHIEDRISVNNPDAEILKKMRRIATALGAQVQGDDGEHYDVDGRPLGAEATMPKSGMPHRKPWWRFW